MPISFFRLRIAFDQFRFSSGFCCFHDWFFIGFSSRTNRHAITPLWQLYAYIKHLPRWLYYYSQRRLCTCTM